MSLGRAMSCALLLLLSAISVAAQSSPRTLLVTNGLLSETTYGTGNPWLIFHDEILNFEGLKLPNIERGLTCRSNTDFSARWHFTNGFPVPNSGDVFGPIPFIQVLTGAGAVPSIAQLALTFSKEPNYTHSNGLFTCRLNGNEEGSIPVGVYVRGEGRSYSSFVDHTSLLQNNKTST